MKSPVIRNSCGVVAAEERKELMITVTLRNSTVELTYRRTENEIYRKIMIDER